MGKNIGKKNISSSDLQNYTQEHCTFCFLLTKHFIWIRNGLSDKESSHRRNTMGFSAVRATSDAQRGIKGRIRLENTFANLNRGWLPHKSLFQCHYPGTRK